MDECVAPAFACGAPDPWFSSLNIREPLNVAPFPARESTWSDVVMNAELRKDMVYADEEKRRGDMAEDLFKVCAEDLGYRVHLATQEEDLTKHIDFHLYTKLPGSEKMKHIAVDVKARKKIRRSDRGTAFETSGGGEGELFWLELHGASQFSKGWLMEGHADCIAFETETSFVLFDRQKLADGIRGGSLVKFNEFARSPEDARNKVYKRGAILGNGKHDETTIVALKDLMAFYPGSLFQEWSKQGGIVAP